MAYSDPNKPILARKLIVTNSFGEVITIDPSLIAFDEKSRNPEETSASVIFASGNAGTSFWRIQGASAAGVVNPFFEIQTHGASGTPANSSEINVFADKIRFTSSVDTNFNIVYESATGVMRRENEIWQGTATIPLTGAWVDTAGARFGVYKDASGNVHLRGLVKSGAAVAVVTLPLGYRPSSNMDFSMRSGTTLCAVNVAPTGAVTVTANFAAIGAVGIDLSVVNFPTF